MAVFFGAVIVLGFACVGILNLVSSGSDAAETPAMEMPAPTPTRQVKPTVANPTLNVDRQVGGICDAALSGLIPTPDDWARIKRVKINEIGIGQDHAARVVAQAQRMLKSPNTLTARDVNDLVILCEDWKLTNYNRGIK